MDLKVREMAQPSKPQTAISLYKPQSCKFYKDLRARVMRRRSLQLRQLPSVRLQARKSVVARYLAAELWTDGYRYGCSFPCSDKISHVKKHIASFPTVESHDIREKAKLYLEQNLNHAIMHDLYREQYTDRKVKCFKFYYRPKLSLYNLTFHCSLDKSPYCCIWNEAEGGRCGNTIRSALLEVWTSSPKIIPPSIKLFCGQTLVLPKKGMSNALCPFKYHETHPHINVMTQKYSEAGHYLVQEVDSMHSNIERHLARCEVFSLFSKM
ncbi:hypothetical protein PoB_003173600 [Plakobranchus ocellatus]|uniref:Uncharacterized protein n=1 Tax=Plakobranchus ocellatus TaxID=259542 RepID=A0AAV4A1Y6_9GAST|nr:hypothetical protein PoB_003173600 [Plakobranchus ocellatus]